jgi:hypothetical protein
VQLAAPLVEIENVSAAASTKEPAADPATDSTDGSDDPADPADRLSWQHRHSLELTE